MSRKHLFAIVVLLGAAAVAGLLALTRTSQVGATTTQSSSTQIAARTRSLDQFEASLRRSLAELPPARPASRQAAGPPAPRTVFVRSGAPAAAHADDDDHEDDDHEDEDDDD
jgi:hypothetical protein